MEVSTRPADSDDEQLLFELYASTRSDELDEWGWSEDQRKAFLEMQFAAQRHSYRQTFPSVDHRIITLDAQPIGRIMIDRTPDEIRLVDISLLPAHRNRGIGGCFVRELLDESLRTGVPVRLSVVEGSQAVALYERLGFSMIAADGVYQQMEARGARS